MGFAGYRVSFLDVRVIILLVLYQSYYTFSEMGKIACANLATV